MSLRPICALMLKLPSDHTLRAVWAVALIALIIAWIRKDRWPSQDTLLTAVSTAPKQTPIDRPPFQERRHGLDYVITPRYRYDLYGLVVSRNDSASFADYYHDAWKDFLNTGDLCIVWGQNVRSGVYRRVKYTSGSWTCYFELPADMDPSERSSFNGHELSNNHVLPANDQINRRILSVRRGDQIHFTGYLVDYAHQGDAWSRRTSTTRDDELCEIVYVTDFEVLRRANPGWRFVYALALPLVVISSILLAVRTFLAPPW